LSGSQIQATGFAGGNDYTSPDSEKSNEKLFFG
jgi:hypothetical protein